MQIVPFYDRTQLIERATHTLKRALIEELILVTLAHIIFLAHFRSILIVTIPLPLAVLTVISLHVLHGHQLEPDVACGHRDRHRRAGRCGNRSY